MSRVFEFPATIFSPGAISKSPPFHPPPPPPPPHPNHYPHHHHRGFPHSTHPSYKPVANGMLGLNPHPLAGGFQVQSKLEASSCRILQANFYSINRSQSHRLFCYCLETLKAVYTV